VPGVIMKKELHHDGSSVTYRSVEHNKCDLMEEFCKRVENPKKELLKVLM